MFRIISRCVMWFPPDIRRHVCKANRPRSERTFATEDTSARAGIRDNN